jgi:predicted nucleotidyltransferase
VFTPADRARLREALIAAARDDPRVTAAALTGSAAVGREDRWSDVDLALCVGTDPDLNGVVEDWTARLYDEHGAVHHVDVWRGTTRFRVFLLRSTLQVDIAFWPAAEFGPIGPSFQLLFGSANERTPDQPPEPVHLIGMAWLYALHARSGIARGRRWHAEYMLSAARDQVLALACVRHGLPAAYARGADALPAEVTAPMEAALVGSLDPAELARALRVVLERLMDETQRTDPGLAERLAGPLAELAQPASPSGG